MTKQTNIAYEVAADIYIRYHNDEEGYESGSDVVEMMMALFNDLNEGADLKAWMEA